MSEQHPNSKKVTIFRCGTFLSRAQGTNADEHFQNSKVSIGSYFEGKGSKKVASGLEFDEEELLLPKIIDTPKEDKEFRKKVTDFYIDLDTKVPFNTGLELEIGLEENNGAKLTAKNFPINLMDYIRYRHALKHPFVAESEETGKGNSLKQYYIFDKDTVQNKNAAKRRDKDTALGIYLTIEKEGTEKIDMMLTLMGIDPRVFTGKNKDEDKAEKLRELAETQSTKFVETHGEAELEIRYWINSMLNTGVIKKFGERYVDGETRSTIGDNLEATIMFFKDDDKADEVLLYKQRMQEAMAQALPKNSRKTQPLGGAELRQ